MDLKLAGSHCLITGASSGIGRAIACMLAREQVRVAIAGRNRAALEALHDELCAEGLPAPVVCVGDVSTGAGVSAVAESALQALGEIHMLVNNAGGSRPLQADDGDDVWREAFDLNFFAARRLSSLIVPQMIAAGGGRIINISGAVVSAALNAAVPAKAALQSWSKALASELAPSGITVNCVAPGRINSRQILQTLHPDPDARAAYIARNIPLGRFGEPEEFASVVTFLLSPLAAYVTGTVIPVDGGMHRLAL